MAKADRLRIIREIEQKRGSRVICYLTGDRPGFETQIGMDVFLYFYECLQLFGKVQAIDLFIYSQGGMTMAAWGLVTLLREYCSKLGVLIPYRAHSSATLIALGADEIVMTSLGQLSPVDPSVTTPYNPTAPAGLPNQVNYLPVSVEDVTAFLELAKDEVGIRGSNNLTKVFEQLSDHVKPLALGNVYRAHEQIRMLTKKLLSLHMKGWNESRKKKKIIKILTRDLYSHDYLIRRTEAKDTIGLKIQTDEKSKDIEKLISELFREYESAMQLSVPYNPTVALGANQQATIDFERAYIETSDKSIVFKTQWELKNVPVTQAGITIPTIQQKPIKEGWEYV